MNKIFEMINKRTQEKNTIEFTDLAPIDDIENGDEYLNALHWAMANEKVKNIALAGPYGSGKSSIIETYLKKNKNIKRKSLRISMATFVENETDEKGNHKKITFEQDEIELGILKQLFYKVNYKMIPQSRYRKLHKINWKHIWIKLIFVLAILCFMGFIFSPNKFHDVIEKINTAGQQFGLSRNVSQGLFCFFCLIVLAIIARIYRSILSQFKINEIKLPTETVVKNTELTTESVFNKNMDEIVYFFEETDYRVVFFEDLDRLENPSIFIHLRELNTLLNNYDGIKERIIFVYAIKDDIFSDTDRTKFFDFIIPVIPVINSTNSGEIFLQKLDESKNKGIMHEISQGFILDVAPYVEDMRILQNIYNEFIIYKKMIRTKQELKLSDETMMALIIFKNLYPRDFADLQMERGIIKQAFADKQRYIVTQCEIWREKITQLTNALETYHEDSLGKIKELKVSMLSEMVKWQGIACSIHIPYYNYNTITANSIMADSFDWTELLKVTKCTISYSLWSGSNANTNISDLQKNIRPYYDRIRAFQHVQEKGYSELQSEIEDLKNKIHELSGWSFKRIMDEFNIQDILSDIVRENKLLVFLLRRGYLDEKYANYINYFKGTSITKEDMNFILAIKNMEKLPYRYNLSKVDMVIQHLQVYEFEQKSIYNFILLDYLLSEENDIEKLNALIEQLADEKEESWNFINEFIDTTQYRDKFIRLLAMRWDNIWNYIVENITLTYERKIFYLVLIINSVASERLVVLNSKREMSNFIEDSPDILQRLSSIKNQKIISVVENLGIIFKNVLIENVPEEILTYIFENQCYELNATMISRIIEFNDKTMISELDIRNYTTIIKAGYEPLIIFARENLKHYVETIVLAPDNVKEEIEQIIDLLERCIHDTEMCIKLIKHEEFCLNDISECCGDLGGKFDNEVKALWNELLSERKVELSWGNIEHYWVKYGLTPELLQYIETNCMCLEWLDSKCISEDFIRKFILSTVNENVFEKLLSKLKLENFDIQFDNISEPKVEIMIKQRYFPFTANRYEEINAVYPELCAEFILYNQNEYKTLLTSISMNQLLLEKLILSPMLVLSNAKLLLKTFGKDCMNVRIAEKLLKLNVAVDITVFDAAWVYLDEEGKNELMFKCLSILDADKFEYCFSDLSKWYPKFSDRSRKHNVELENTEENRRLAERLKEVSYITSFAEQEKEKYDAATETRKKVGIISCRIKATKE